MSTPAPPAIGPVAPRRGVVFALVALVIVLLGASGTLFQMYRRAAAPQEPWQARQRAERLRAARAFRAIAEIQDSLNAISTEAVAPVAPRRAGWFAVEPPERSTNDVMARISAVRARLDHNRQRIAELEATVGQSELRASGAMQLVTGLRRTLALKDGQIRQLASQVRRLNAQVANLETDVERRDDAIHRRDRTIETRRREAGTIYYVIGDRRELAADSIVVATGGVLGLGRVLQVSSHLDDAAFTPLDTDRDSTISFRAPAARVITPQPTSSYALRRAGDRMQLRILDRRRFREVRHLVIVTDELR